MPSGGRKRARNFDTMNTGFETLLQAARYIEWQEQQNLSPLPTSPSSSSLNGRNVHSPLYNNNNSTNINNNTNNNNNNSSSSINNLRHHNNHQVSSPPISPVISTIANHTATTNGGIIGIVGLGAATALASVANSNSSHNIGTINSHDYHEYDTSSLSVALARANDGRNEEPYTNGHSLSPSYLLISANNNTSTTTSTTTTSNQPNQNHICDSYMSDIQMERDNNNSTNYLTKQSVIINNNTINYSPAPISNSWTSASSSRLLLPSSTSSLSFTINKTNLNKKIYPLTPPPMPSRKLVEITRTRSSSLSSNKITANGGSGAATTTITTVPSTAGTTISTTGSVAIGLGTSSPTILNGAIVLQNGNAHHNVLASATEDSSQSSLNLSSSGYLSGSSANSSIGGGGGSGSNHLNISNSSTSSLTNGLAGVTSTSILNGSSSDNHLGMQAAQATATGRRRTTSTNSNGGTQRSPCILRAGTREVHNKLEKHRRAHLKECFENLKVQLQLRDEEKKKTSNLAILGAAYRQVMTLKRKERELEQQVEQLAKDKINSQKKILSLKRELAAKYDNIDFANVMSHGDIGIIPGERVTDGLSDTLSSGRGSTRYSSSSSLSSAATMSSPSGSSGGVLQTAMPTTMSPVIPSLMPSHLTSPNSPHLKSVSPVGNSIPLSLTVKNLTALTRCSPTPSIPSPSSSGISSSSPIVSSSSSPSSTSSLSSSPPMSWHSPSVSLKIPNVPNGVKVPPIISSSSPPSSSSSSSSNLSIVSSTTNCSSASSSPVINFTTCENSILSPTLLTTANSGLPLNLNAGSHSVQILHTQKDLNGKNGVCRKSSEMHDSSTLHHHQQSAGMILTSNSSMATKEKMFDESEQPTKVIKLVNGIALAPMDKDNKLLSSTPLALSQVVVSPFQMFTTTTQGLRVLGANGLATIELSTPTVQSQSRNHLQSSPTSTVTPTTGAQLHKLLVSGTTTVTSSGLSTNSSPATSVASELARLPGGAEVNILPAGVMPRNGKLAIVNNGITLKGADSTGNNGRAVHVVTPLQSGGTPISSLTPIVVSQGQAANSLAHLIASSSQLAGKVNLSVGGQALPLISTQYLSSMKPMVVAVANNTTPTLSSVPPTATSVAIATVTANGSVS